MASQDNTSSAPVDAQQPVDTAPSAPLPPLPLSYLSTWQPVERQIRSCYWEWAYNHLSSLPAGQEDTTTVYSRPEEWTYKMTRHADNTYTVQKYYGGQFKYSHPYNPDLI